MQKRKRQLMTLVLALAVFVFTVSAQAASIVTSGWNADLVYEYTPGDVNEGVDSSTTTAWLETGEGNSFTGLPVGGSLPSLNTIGVTYQFQAYSAKNAILMKDASTYTIPVTNGQYSKLYVLATSGNAGTNGPFTSDIKLNFAGGSTTTFSGSEGLYAPDWYNGVSGVANGGFSRTNSGASSPDSLGANFYFYESVLSLSPTDQGETLLSIDFTRVNDVFATSIYDVQGSPVPIPGAALLLGAGLARLLAYRRRQ